MRFGKSTEHESIREIYLPARPAPSEDIPKRTKKDEHHWSETMDVSIFIARGMEKKLNRRTRKPFHCRNAGATIIIAIVKRDSDVEDNYVETHVCTFR